METGRPLLSPPRLCVVVPCFNEDEVLYATASRLRLVIEGLAEEGLIARKSFIFFVDDGSEDQTWEQIRDLSESSEVYSGLRLGVNAGHQMALRAGFSEALPIADLFVSIDADLQDDPDVLKSMVEHVLDGAEVVLGVRSDRSSDSFAKRTTAGLFYRISEFLGVPTVRHHADYRMMSRHALTRLLASQEREIYWRASSLTVSKKIATVEFSRHERLHGSSKYTGRKMWGLALNAVISWSSRPLRAISLLGLGVSALSLCALLYVMLSLLSGKVVTGWVSLAASMYFLFGVSLLALGAVGEYLRQVLDQVKGRPLFHIADRAGPRRDLV